jgi:outer membrane lipopolysaccharide assembly protein LptE/RlpB
MYTRQLFKSFVFIFSMTLVLSSCGWHLRGTQTVLPAELQKVRLVTEQKDKQLHLALERALQSAGATIIENSDSPAYKLTVTSVSSDRRGVSTTSRGKTAEYSLTSRITFTVADSLNQEVLSNVTVSREKTYYFDQTSVTSSFDEEKLLLAEMQRDLVQQIIRHYRAIKNQ